MGTLCFRVTPGMLLNEPVGSGTVTPRALNEFRLKPSTTSQKAFGQRPALVLMTSWTSSLPNVSLST
jgi:hypothetical protein